jgi:hypothetical protein
MIIVIIFRQTCWTRGGPVSVVDKTWDQQGWSVVRRELDQGMEESFNTLTKPEWLALYYLPVSSTDEFWVLIFWDARRLLRHDVVEVVFVVDQHDVNLDIPVEPVHQLVD